MSKEKKCDCSNCIKEREELMKTAIKEQGEIKEKQFFNSLVGNLRKHREELSRKK